MFFVFDTLFLLKYLVSRAGNGGFLVKYVRDTLYFFR